MVLKTVMIAPGDVAVRCSNRLGISFTNRSSAGQIIYLVKGGSSGLTTNNAEYVLSVGESLHFLLEFDGSDIMDSWGAMASADSASLYVGETIKRPGG
jgi:hypothetical protein